MIEKKFLISGKERRAKKKEVAELKRYVKMFWFYEDVDRVYGCGLKDETCHKLINIANNKIIEIKELLLKEI